MNAVETIAVAARATGYRSEAVVRNYAFADVLTSSVTTRKVPLVGFTQTPPSYRSAAFAVIQGQGEDPHNLVQAHRALGAPLLFVVEDSQVTVWQVRSSGPPRVLERTTVSKIPALFKQKRDIWNPDAIHRAKAVGSFEKEYQLDFVDLGLLPAIEGEIHIKLDRLLLDTLTAARGAQKTKALDIRTLFRIIFRLLAAKVLQDRNHPHAQKWDVDDLQSVLKGIESYYALDKISILATHKVIPAYEEAWQCLRAGISFSNISSEDLAFVYENTLVTPDARRLFGTHSTPRQVAEYIVQRLNLHAYDPEEIQIYEPFAGAGIFLISALRHLRNLLPVDWTDQKRHNFLVRHLRGDEIDPFACEVACLSLILADYPNHNGWHINEADLFRDDSLKKRMLQSNVILCNPPFESFTSKERGEYSVASETHSKALAALNAALDSHPVALGFVLPRPFILGRNFLNQRSRLERLYSNIELVELPDRIFGAADIEASLLIATDPRKNASTNITLTSTEISDADRLQFLKTGEITVQRQITRKTSERAAGELWIPPLTSLWDFMSSYLRVKSKFVVSRGIEWTYKQTNASSDRKQQGFRKGLDTTRRLQQFDINSSSWLDFRLESLRCNFEKEWDRPKIIMNSSRLSRGPWRIAASADDQGLIFSQQFFGLWPAESTEYEQLISLAAILNGPVANAYLTLHSPLKVFRASVIEQIPLPRFIPAELSSLINEYMGLLSSRTIGVDQKLDQILFKIDAAVLKGYDLPPRLEQELLRFFYDAKRPVAHEWTHWDSLIPCHGLRLFERPAARSNPNWVQEVFHSLPEKEAAFLREYGA